MSFFCADLSTVGIGNNPLAVSNDKNDSFSSRYVLPIGPILCLDPGKKTSLSTREAVKNKKVPGGANCRN